MGSPRPLTPVLLSALLWGCAGAQGHQHGTSLPPRFQGTDAVQVSVYAVSLKDGRVICSSRPRLLMRPASTMKLVTTIPVCIERSDMSVVTRMQAQRRDGGALRLIGGADPLLSTEDLKRMVSELRSKGLKRVTSVEYRDPLGGQPRFGQGWMWDDEPAAFMPHISGLTVDGGTVQVGARMVEGRLTATVHPPSDHTPLVTKPGDQACRITRDWRVGSNTITVTGRVSGSAPYSRRVSVTDPARHSAEVLKRILMDAGLADDQAPVRPVSAADDIDVGAAALEARRTRTLPALLAASNKDSDNLTAELLLRHLGAVQEGGPGSASAGHARVLALLSRVGVPEGRYRLADGSGVSHYNLVSADLLVRLLVHAHNADRPAPDLFKSSLSVAGVDGTLARRMGGTATRGRVRAKTGTVSAVCTLAGYLDTRTGEPVAFAIMIQNFVGSPAPWRALQDRICAYLVDR